MNRSCVRQRGICEMPVQTAWDLQDVCADSLCERTDTVDARVPDASYRETRAGDLGRAAKSRGGWEGGEDPG